MSSLNGDVKKCPHGLDLAKYREDYNIDFSFEPLRCEKCHAKLLPNEFATDKMKTSSLCCAKGQIKCEGKPWQMSFVKDPPDLIKNLCTRTKLDNGEYQDPHYTKNSRKYNNACAMASIGIADEVVMKSGWNPNVKIHGKIHHRIGNLFPAPGEKPRFAQIIVHDSNFDEEEMYLRQLERRMEVVRGVSSKDREKYSKAWK